MTIQTIECRSNSDAIQHADASGFGEPVLVDGKPMVVPQSDIDRMAAAGIEFAYLCHASMPNVSERTLFQPILMSCTVARRVPYSRPAFFRNAASRNPVEPTKIG